MNVPKALEAKLKREAEKKYRTIKDIKKRTKKINAYTYGDMRNMGRKPSHER